VLFISILFVCTCIVLPLRLMSANGLLSEIKDQNISFLYIPLQYPLQLNMLNFRYTNMLLFFFCKRMLSNKTQYYQLPLICSIHITWRKHYSFIEQQVLQSQSL
jgi:hypothetical protein